MTRPRIAYVCEGYADIRMLKAFAEVADLSLLIRDADYDADRVSQAGLALEVLRLPSARILALPAIFLRLLARPADAVIALDARGGALAAGLACRLRGRPLLVQILTDPVAYWDCRPSRGLLHALGRRILSAFLETDLRLATRVFGMGGHYRTLLGERAAKYREVNLYGLDPERLAPIPPGDRPAVRVSLGLPPAPPLLFYSSRVAPEKDTETLLEAAGILWREGASFTLLNTSGQHREFEALARRLGLEGRALSRPAAHPETELPRYYQASDLCIQASRAEGFGWSPREALACGTPVIVADVGGLRGDFEGMGLPYPPGDAAALAARIREALADPARMQAMADRGRTYVLGRYGRGKAVADLAALLEEVGL